MDHLQEDWANGLSERARRAVTPHLPKVPGRIVYSVGGLRDDRDEFRSYFSPASFPDDWPDIQKLMDPG
jgi:hypothetical protein